MIELYRLMHWLGKSFESQEDTLLRIIQCRTLYRSYLRRIVRFHLVSQEWFWQKWCTQRSQLPLWDSKKN